MGYQILKENTIHWTIIVEMQIDIDYFETLPSTKRIQDIVWKNYILQKDQFIRGKNGRTKNSKTSI